MGVKYGCYFSPEVTPMRRIWFTVVFLLGGAALLPAILLAQLPKVAKKAPGDLDGIVVNAKGAPVAGAQIVWQVADGSRPHAVQSDEQGRFRIARLRTGLYELRASSGDESSEWAHNVLVRPGAASNVKLRLAPPPPPPVAVELKGTMRTWDLPLPGALPPDSPIYPTGTHTFPLSRR